MIIKRFKKKEKIYQNQVDQLALKKKRLLYEQKIEELAYQHS